MMENAYGNSNITIAIDSTLEKFVLESIKQTDDNLLYAFLVYNKLNEILSFNPDVVVAQCNKLEELDKKLLYQKANTITLENNAITCLIWSEIYLYFLQKRGIDARIINNEKYHRYVEISLNGLSIIADATVRGDMGLTDLARAKLGFEPKGFKIYENSNKKVFKSIREYIIRMIL